MKHKYGVTAFPIIAFFGISLVLAASAYAADTTPPAGTIIINNNATYTISTSVTLGLSAIDTESGMGAGSQMSFSDDNASWSNPEAYAPTRTWTLIWGLGPRTVYVKFKDAIGNWSGAFSDTIILDIAPPTVGISINDNSGYTNSGTVTLNLYASDPTSGMGAGSQMRFSHDDINWSLPEPYQTVKTWTLTPGTGEKSVYAKFKDVAGNWSPSVHETITLIAANAAPSVGIAVPSSGQSAPNAAVSFISTYTDPDGCQDIKEAYLLINTSTSGAGGFYAYFDSVANRLYLRNSINSGWLGGFAPASSGVIENYYATLDCSGTRVYKSGNTLAIIWRVTFKPACTGSKNTYLYVKDIYGDYNGWVKKGTWTVTSITPPQITITEPINGAIIDAEP